MCVCVWGTFDYCQLCSLYSCIGISTPSYPHPVCEQLLREGRPEERIQTRTGQMVSLLQSELNARLSHLLVFSHVFLFTQTADFLKTCKLRVIKMPVDDFQVNKEVLCRRFLKVWGCFFFSFTFLTPYSTEDLRLTLKL